MLDDTARTSEVVSNSWASYLKMRKAAVNNRVGNALSELAERRIEIDLLLGATTAKLMSRTAQADARASWYSVKVLVAQMPDITDQTTPDFEAGSVVILHLPREGVGAVLSGNYQGDLLSDLTAQTTALVLEHLLSEPLSRLETSLSRALRIASIVADVMPPEHDLAFDLVYPDKAPIPVLFTGPVDILDALARQIADQSPEIIHSPLDAETCELCLCTQTMVIGTEDIYDLAADDVLSLDPAFNSSHFRLLLDGRFTAPLRTTDGGYALSNTPDATPKLRTSSGDVAFYIRLDSTELPLLEVQEFGEGSVLPFGLRREGNATLVIEGIEMAGTIINMAGTPAFRVHEQD
ncbi:MAG: hypothetical protein WBG95_05165 [Sulfitobacter sp.]